MYVEMCYLNYLSSGVVLVNGMNQILTKDLLNFAIWLRPAGKGYAEFARSCDASTKAYSYVV